MEGFQGVCVLGAKIYYFVEFLSVYVHFGGVQLYIAFFRFSKGSVTPKKVKKHWCRL